MKVYQKEVIIGSTILCITIITVAGIILAGNETSGNGENTISSGEDIAAMITKKLDETEFKKESEYITSESGLTIQVQEISEGTTEETTILSLSMDETDNTNVSYDVLATPESDDQAVEVEAETQPEETDVPTQEQIEMPTVAPIPVITPVATVSNPTIDDIKNSFVFQNEMTGQVYSGWDQVSNMTFAWTMVDRSGTVKMGSGGLRLLSSPYSNVDFGNNWGGYNNLVLYNENGAQIDVFIDGGLGFSFIVKCPNTENLYTAATLRDFYY